MIFFDFLLFLSASRRVPAGGQHASSYSWHAQRDHSRWQRIVLVKDKRTHLEGFSSSRRFVCSDKAKKKCPRNDLSAIVMASADRQHGTGTKMASCQGNNNMHICKRKHLYGERNISDASNIFGEDIPSRERLKTEMASCQTRIARHLQASSKSVQNCCQW